MKQDKVLSMLGLSAKAGNVASGEFSTEKAVKEGKAHLVIVAGDASDNTKKHFRDMCSFYEVPFYAYADKESRTSYWKRISGIIGSYQRRSCQSRHKAIETVNN